MFRILICLALLLFAQTELSLVGNKAPDFEANAIFNQEFIKVAYIEQMSRISVALVIAFAISKLEWVIKL